MKLDSIHIALIVVIIGLVIYCGHKSNSVESFNPNLYPDISKKKLAISKIMVKLWVQHLLYTRLAMMAVLDADADVDKLSARLMQNPNDFGNAISNLYGTEVGNAVQKLLKEHLEIAVKVINTVRIDSKYDQHMATNELYKNADDIGSYLDALTNNSKELFRHHMKMHIDTLLDNVTAYASNNYVRDINTLDKYFNAGIDMAFDMANN